MKRSTSLSDLAKAYQDIFYPPPRKNSAKKGTKMTSEHLPYWLAALYLPHSSPRQFLEIVKLFSTIKDLFAATPSELSAKGINNRFIRALQSPNWKSVEEDLAWA